MPDKNSERHVMDRLTEELKEKEGLNLKDRKELDPPNPDFLVKVKEETIGVEVRRFSTQGDRFKANGFLDTALDHGKQIFCDNGGPANYNGPQYSGQELSKKFGLTHPYKWRIENVNQTDSSYSEIQVYYCR